MPTFNGYGFNLHAEKNKPGQYIGKVDEGSPAALAGLREGDRIIEVNGVNVSSENHHQVVQRIKAVENETKFLVVDPETDDYYRDRNEVISGDMENILLLETPVSTTEVPTTHESVEVPTTLEEAEVLTTLEEAEVPATLDEVEVPSTLEAAEVPSTLESSEVPSTLESAEVPSTLEAAEVPSTLEATEVPSTLETVEIPSTLESVVIASTLDSVDNGDDYKHRPRLCQVKLWSDFPGYGFNLHAEKGKSAQYIGKVDEKSPAEAAGLRESDRIIEVNGESVLSETHQEVVKRIKADSKQVTMLLLDPEAEQYFKEKGIIVSSSLPSVEKIECPDNNPHAAATRDISKGTDFEGHQLRLCHIRSTPDGKGYGFNMQADKSRTGQFIGAVDSGSAADKAGLKSGDRIIEVNGVSVVNDTHKQVVDKIKAKQNETILLVVDQESDEYFSSKSIALSSSLACVMKSENSIENGTSSTHAESNEIATKPITLKLDVTADSKNSTAEPRKTLESPKSPVVISGIEFAASAEEARRRMSKKKSVKDTSMSMKDKYALFQKM